jgi:hypothetical protein
MAVNWFHLKQDRYQTQQHSVLKKTADGAVSNVEQTLPRNLLFQNAIQSMVHA